MNTLSFQFLTDWKENCHLISKYIIYGLISDQGPRPSLTNKCSILHIYSHRMLCVRLSKIPMMRALRPAFEASTAYPVGQAAWSMGWVQVTVISSFSQETSTSNRSSGCSFFIAKQLVGLCKNCFFYFFSKMLIFYVV